MIDVANQADQLQHPIAIALDEERIGTDARPRKVELRAGLVVEIGPDHDADRGSVQVEQRMNQPTGSGSDRRDVSGRMQGGGDDPEASR